MNDRFAIGTFLTRWSGRIVHDMSGSDSETLSAVALLDLAEPDDLDRWRALGFGYCDPRGAPWLRAAIARRHGHLDHDAILCCAGAQEAVACVATALLAPDDHAIVILPIYQPSELAVTRLCAATGVPLEFGSWSLDVERVAAAIWPNTRMVLANFPNSPTGATLDPDAMRDLVALCRRHGLWLVNDEVYRQTDASAACADLPAVADAYERGVSINGLSKGFGLPGLRLGWLACEDPVLLSLALQAKNGLSSCISSATEVLAHVALRAESAVVERTRAIGRRNHARLGALVERFPDLFEASEPRNLAFAFPRYTGPGTAEAFADRMAREARLLLLPSVLWRSSLGRVPAQHLRIGLGHARVASGLDALQDHLSIRQAA